MRNIIMWRTYIMYQHACRICNGKQNTLYYILLQIIRFFELFHKAWSGVHGPKCMTNVLEINLL
jgi:hypothetical protein